MTMASGPAKLTNRNLPLLLLQAREHVMARFRPLLNAHGITEQQWRVIRVLLETGPLEPREIGSLCQISSPSLAGVLSRMEDMDLVVRKRLDSDQSRVRVSLKSRSRALASCMTPKINATYQQIEASIGLEASRPLYKVLDELVAVLAPPAPAGKRDSASRRAKVSAVPCSRNARENYRQGWRTLCFRAHWLHIYSGRIIRYRCAL
jgi:homoprotocatechuate degradation regulator HpaR